MTKPLNTKRYTHFVWDWNGTLLNDVWLSVRSINEVLVSRKLNTLTEAEYKELFDFPVKDYYARLGFNFDTDPFEVVGTEFIVAYDAHTRECELQRAAPDVLRQLNSAGKHSIVLSARKHQQLDEEMYFFGLDKLMLDWHGLDNHYAESKIGIGHKLLERNNVNPQKALMIGDTLHDAEVAKALGIDCVLFTGGHQALRKLQLANVPLIASLSELI